VCWFAQIIAACYALSLDLRLQVLWSAKSAIIPGGYNVDAMCRYVGQDCSCSGNNMRSAATVAIDGVCSLVLKLLVIQQVSFVPSACM
jgi:hypothetical protein